MSDIENGGPAFPIPIGAGDDCDKHWRRGMSLRDYFAAQIIAGIVYSARGDGIEIKSPAEEARTAYAYADAMLKAREA